MWDLALISTLIIFVAFGTRNANAQTQVAVEYYYNAWNYYFVTAFPGEIASLDGGAFGGLWKRTGQTFNVLQQPAGNAFPTCRFFSTTFAPKSSHFYTPYSAECSAVKANVNWQYEAVAFYLQLPDANGVCSAGTDPLYRLYNNGMGGAPNHRYTTSGGIFNQMVAAGWIFEGNGLTGAFACVPQSQTTSGTAEGLWFGSTNTAESVTGIVLDNGTFYFLYSSPDSNYVAGVVQGTGASVNGQFTSSDARDFSIAGYGVTTATISGTYTSKASLAGVISSALGSASYTASYQSIYQQPASLAATAGTYAGSAASSAGVQSATVTVSASGAISGAVPGCSFSGTATPRGTVNVFNLTVKFNGGTCVFGTSTLSGIAYYDAPSRQIYGVAPNASRTDGFLFIGGK
jgi:Repeat of unknown function (DUF5648)